ncbi:hypothetical protein [Thiobacter aerophilum]|uniref:Uncharacterized protein n=1 Tax=Thiobacter aerophilum TaxID=3121275 RepID=A0ABV0EHE7_9BURK
MRNLAKGILCAVLCFGVVTASGAEMELTLEIPACKMPPGKPLPPKYYAAARKWKEFGWVRSVSGADSVVYGTGWEGLRGSGLYANFYFYKLDLNSDGFCDWVLVYQTPALSVVSQDFEILNTFFLGTHNGWVRIGATVFKDDPDSIDRLVSKADQGRFAYFSDPPLLILDIHLNHSFIIGTFEHPDNDHPTAKRVHRYGYCVYLWNTHTNTLEELDKWQPGSAAAQVYAFFKKHGAVNVAESGASRIARFDPDIEKAEFESGCKDERALKRSPYFAKACQSRKQ